jgi:hypothetical protein
MTNSLIKFASHKNGGERGDLFWSRAGVDGLPFRGKQAPPFRNEEFEERCVRVADPKNGTFYTGDLEENTAYLKVMDGVANGWFHLLFIDRWRSEDDKQHQIYAEWVEYYLEDGSATPYNSQGTTGM